MRIGWTAASSSNGFLALDRNGNGNIDDGTELFGNFTPQPKSIHPNGFAALAEYDKVENGGNSDGLIDENDGVFSSLRMWVDSNHDGVAQPDELLTLRQAGIQSLTLEYVRSMRRDEFGNLFRYKARVRFDGEPQNSPGKVAYDVFLTVK